MKAASWMGASAGLLLGSVLLVGTLVGCDGGESATEAMQKSPEEEFEKNYKPNPKPPPPDKLPPPTEDELAAWDRKDPEGEKRYYKWDKKHLGQMNDYWKELTCFREKMKLEGDKAFGKEPLGPEKEAFDQFKAGFVLFADGWQKRLFAEQGRSILEKSLFIGHILEAHELVSNGYPRAYENGDAMELKQQDAHWIIVDDKVSSYAERLGGKWDMPDLSDPKEQEKWDKFCAEALMPPKKGKKK